MYKPFILLFFITIKLSAQSLTGMSGMLTIPDGELLGEGKTVIGVNFLDQDYLPPSYNDDAIAYYAAIGFLPFAELGLRFTKHLAPHDALGDRMFSIKLKLVEEGDLLPAVAAGIHDFIHSTESKTNRFNSSYIVLEKNFFSEDITSLTINAGYGTKLFKAKDYQFIGFFGGVSLSLFPFEGKANFAELLLEYDAERLNGGVRVTVFDSIRVLAGLMNFEKFSGGLSFSFIL